ncbi:MAG: heparinase II/III family protein [Rhizobiaceae bacterium]
MAIADQPRLIALVLAERLKRARKRAGDMVRPSLGVATPDRLLLAPPDLGTADPTVAHDIYAGNFFFAGKSANAAGSSPFRIPPPDAAWERELHSFRWLRHLAASRDSLSSSNAQAFVRDWIALDTRHKGSETVWDVESASARLVSWLCHSVLIIGNADLQFYRSFLKSVGQHIRYLRRESRNAPDGMPRLMGSIALAYASICVSGQSSILRNAERNLDHELQRQIYPDGGHASRNPSNLPIILALLLPLRQSISRLGRPPSAELISAIDRMMGAVRFFRLGDGSFTHVNGTATTAHDLIATVLRYDDTGGLTGTDLPYTGYQRMQQDLTVLLMDTGKPPAGEMSGGAHAGCLSFEMSHGSAPFIINCGAPVRPDPRAIEAARTTAAHSTVTINDRSSCQFSGQGIFGRMLDSRILDGPRNVPSSREDVEGMLTVTASHDGYLRNQGIIHERSLTLSRTGSVLDGSDHFLGAGGKALRNAAGLRATIRFHLHPSVAAGKASDGRTILLSLADGSRWSMVCRTAVASLEESIFFSASTGARRTSQIVIACQLNGIQEISWRFERLARR